MDLIETSAQIQNRLERIMAGLWEKAKVMGLSLSVWDTHGQCLDGVHAGSEMCRMICQVGGDCRKKSYELAQYVMDNQKPSRDTAAHGCCLIGLPIFERRRVIGALVLGYPTQEMKDEEYLARLCDRLRLDRQVMTSYAEQACRHHAVEASHFQSIFAMLLDDTQQAQRASEGLASLSVNLASTYEELSLLFHVSGSMKVSGDPRCFLEDLTDQLLDVMNVELAVAVVYDDRTKLSEDIIVRAGEMMLPDQQLRLLAATQILPKLLDDNASLVKNHFSMDDPSLFGGNIRSLIAVPLVADHECIGVLMGVNKRNNEFNSSDKQLIGSIASQASVFLANHRMYAELQDLLMGVLHSLTESIDAKDPYTCGHSRRVAAISRRLAEACNFNPERVQDIYLSGLLHDVGKIGVPEAILCKDGRLTDEEYNLIKRHPTIGAKILRRIHHLEPIIAGVLSHHERLDGRGYPEGLKGTAVSIEGRIVGLADSWDAMTSHRTYRRALSVERASEEILACAGTQFDPQLVKIFLSWDLDAYMKQLHALNEQDLHLLDEW